MRNVITSIVEWLGNQLGKSRLFIWMANSTLIDKMSKSPKLMNAFDTKFNSLEIWSFVMGWILILVGGAIYLIIWSGSNMISFELRKLYVFFALHMIIFGSVPVMTINFMRGLFNGKKMSENKWHIGSFMAAAQLTTWSLMFLDKKNIGIFVTEQAMASFAFWLLILCTARFFWTKYTTPRI